MADTLVATVEGPLGKAEIYEVTSDQPSGALAVEYEVRGPGEVQKFPALGAAYIAAAKFLGPRPERKTLLQPENRWGDMQACHPICSLAAIPLHSHSAKPVTALGRFRRGHRSVTWARTS